MIFKIFVVSGLTIFLISSFSLILNVSKNIETNSIESRLYATPSEHGKDINHIMSIYDRYRKEDDEQLKMFLSKLIILKAENLDHKMLPSSVQNIIFELENPNYKKL